MFDYKFSAYITMLVIITCSRQLVSATVQIFPQSYFDSRPSLILHISRDHLEKSPSNVELGHQYMKLINNT